MEYTIAFDQVKQFVKTARGPYKFPLLDATTLEKDLRMTGDDGQEFMEAFFEEFSVDYSGFDSSKYFGPEGFDPIGLTVLIRKMLKQQPLSAPIYDITLADLTTAIINRRWVDPVV